MGVYSKALVHGYANRFQMPHVSDPYYSRWAPPDDMNETADTTTVCCWIFSTKTQFSGQDFI